MRREDDDSEQLDDAEEELCRRLAAFTDALAADTPPDASLPATVPAELRAKFRDLQGLILHLDRLWPQRQTPAHRNQPLGTLPGDSTCLGRFELRRCLGHGGFGVVYLARDTLLGRDVAVKVPRLDVFLSPELHPRFLREAQAAAGLDHPHLVPVYEAGMAGAAGYLVSAYCPGPSLAQWREQHPAPADARMAARLVELLADAVHYMHGHGVLHRDIKPSNVLFAPAPGHPDTGPMTDLDLARWVPKLTDFGLAKLVEEEGGQGSGLTKSRTALGTPGYMAPEQAEGRTDEVGPPTDVYSLGVLLYELLTGRPPFLGSNELEVLRQVSEHEPPSPRQLRPGLPRDLATVCLRCLRKEPGKRYASAGELADDLRRFLSGVPVRARPVRPWERAWRWTRRHMGAAAIAAVSIVAVTALAAVILWHLRVADREDLARRRLEYARHLADAQRAWETGDAATALELLNAQRPPPGRLDLRGFEWHYLWRQLQEDGLRIACRQGAIDGVAYAADGRTVATGGADGTVKLWDAATGHMRLRLHAHNGPVRSLGFSPDGTILATAGKGNRIRLWDPATGRERAPLAGHAGQVTCLAFSPDGRVLASGGDDRSLLLWDMPEGRLRHRCQAADYVHAVAFVSDGRTVASTGHNALQFWDAATGQHRADWPTPKYQPVALASSKGGRLLASGASATSQDRGTRLWDVASGQLRGSLAGNEQRGPMLALSPDGHTLAVGRTTIAEGTHDQGHVVRLFDLGSYKRKRVSVSWWDFYLYKTARPDWPVWAVLEQPRGGLGGVAFAPDGLTLAVGGGDDMLRLWRPRRAPSPSAMSHAPEEAWCIAFSPDGRLLVSGGDNEKDKNCLRLWEAKTGRLRWAIPAHEALVTCVAFSSDGRIIASGSFDQKVKLWDPVGGKELAALPGHQALVRCLAFSPDGRLLATGGRDKKVLLWDVGNRRLLRTLAEYDDEIRAIAFSPDGRRLAASGEDQDRTVRLWEVATGRLEHTFSEPHAAYSLAFSPDGGSLALGGKDGRVQLWDLATDRKRTLLADNQGEARTVAFAPDGRILASAGADKLIRLWDPVTGHQLLTLSRHQAPINAIAFSSDSRMLASAGLDGAVRLWKGDTSDDPARLGE
jgi:WD40 repeat protein